MLMKLAIWASGELVAFGNRHVPAEESVAIGTAIRLPNALVGAVTTAVLFAWCQ